MTSLFKRTYVFLDMIRFEHTVFALPFAYLGMMLAAKGLPAWDKVFLDHVGNGGGAHGGDESQSLH